MFPNGSMSSPLSTCSSALIALSGVALTLYCIGIWAARQYTRRTSQTVDPKLLPPITLLKPLKGLEEQLEANLASFFTQDYPAPIQIVFATTDANDVALVVARRVASQYPEIDTRFVVADPDFGLNPKVANLQGAIQAATYDWLLQTDGNVRVESNFLRRLVSEALATNAALVTSIVVGEGERSVGAILENLQLTAFTGPAVCIAREIAGITCVIGKSMLLRKSDLNALGGLAIVKDVLAEDFVLGEAYQKAGHRVLLSNVRARNINVDSNIDRFLSRHTRWLKMRAVVSVPGFIADLLANPVPFALASVFVSGFDQRVILGTLGLIAFKTVADAWLVKRMRGHAMRPAHALLSPLRDVILAGAWFYSMFSRTTEWRGQRFRLGAGSSLTRDEGGIPVRILRRLGFR
jgi:ceramide glucosyltransferase